MRSSGCTCVGVGEADDSVRHASEVDGINSTEAERVGRHLSSCMIGPAASSSSLLNEWLLVRTLQLAGELPDPLPEPAPVQYTVSLPSLQLLSFIVCRGADSHAASAHALPTVYDHGTQDVLLLVRDCRVKRVWRMRECYGRKRAPPTAEAAFQPLSTTETAQVAAHSASQSSCQAADDRFYAAWLSGRQQSAGSDSRMAHSSVAAHQPGTPANEVCASTAASSVPPAPPSTTPLSATPSTAGLPPASASNLRSAIAAARAKSPAFASSLAASSRQSSWKAAPQPFSLFDAWGEAEAWLQAQQSSSEHEQYARCMREQTAMCARQPTQAPPSPLMRPTDSLTRQLDDAADGWSELHALLHHLGFFSSLLPAHSALSASTLPPYSLPVAPLSLSPPSAGASGASLLLLHPSAALSDSIDELDAISDAQLHRILLLTRRAQQKSEWDMLDNGGGAETANAQEERQGAQQQAEEAGEVDGRRASAEALSSLLTSLSALSSGSSRQCEQLVWFVPSRLCPVLLSSAAHSGLGGTADARQPAVCRSLLSACAVRVVWCEGEADYVSPHRQRQRDRRQRRREAKPAGGHLSSSPALLSPHHSPDGDTMSSEALHQPPTPIALVYLVVSFHPADATYRLRVDCDWRLRNSQQRTAKQQQQQQQRPSTRSQSHTNAIISANSTAAVGAPHSSRWLPPPLIKSNSLSNAQMQPPLSLPSPSALTASSSSSSHASTGAVFKSLFKRLGSRSARTHAQQPSDPLNVADTRRGGTDAASSHTAGGSAAGSRTSSLSPVRAPTVSSSLFATRRSPRRAEGAKHDSERSAHTQSTAHPQQHSQQQQQADRRRERADAALRHPILSQPFPPADCSVALSALPARLSDIALLSARRVAAWKEWRAQSRRKRHPEPASRHAAPRTDDSTAVAVNERSRLLQEIVREHGELVTPAVFFETLFGQQGQIATTH